MSIKGQIKENFKEEKVRSNKKLLKTFRWVINNQWTGWNSLLKVPHKVNHVSAISVIGIKIELKKTLANFA